jgi:uncharacterized membrane protein
MIAIDVIWLGVIAKPLYQQGIGHLMAERPNVSFAVLFYLMFPIGLMIFAVHPNATTPWMMVRAALVQRAVRARLPSLVGR